MNYSKVNWSNQTAITKDNLDTMDSGIAALAAEVNGIQSSVTALSVANIQRGAYQFKRSDTVLDSAGKKYIKVTVRFSAKYNVAPTVITQIKSGRVTEGYNVTINNTTTTDFELLLYLPSGQVSSEGIWVQWLAIGS